MDQKNIKRIQKFEEMLIRLRYPFKKDLKQIDEENTHLLIFFQKSSERIQLFEFLLKKACLEEFENFIFISDEQTQHEQIKRIKICLSKIGQLPHNKHSKNLILSKVIEGVSGYESSMNILYQLIKFVHKKEQLGFKKMQELQSQDISSFQNLQNVSKNIHNKYKINSFFNITFPKEDEYFDQNEFEISQSLQEIQDQLDMEIYTDDENNDIFDEITVNTKNEYSQVLDQFMKIQKQQFFDINAIRIFEEFNIENQFQSKIIKKDFESQDVQQIIFDDQFKENFNQMKKFNQNLQEIIINPDIKLFQLKRNLKQMELNFLNENDKNDNCI